MKVLPALKHVDVAELVATLSFEPRRPPVVAPRPMGGVEPAFETLAREFLLSSSGEEDSNRRSWFRCVFRLGRFG